MRTQDRMSGFPRRHVLAYVATIGWDLICWMLVMVIWLFAGIRLEWVNGLWVILNDGSWVKRVFFGGYGGGTMGHGGWVSEAYSGEEGLDSPVEFHEHVHVEQYEVIMFTVMTVNVTMAIASLLLGASYRILWVAGLVQLLGGVIGLISSVIVTKLRGEHAYRGSSHEEAAYAREAIWRRERNM